MSKEQGKAQARGGGEESPPSRPCLQTPKFQSHMTDEETRLDIMESRQQSRSGGERRAGKRQRRQSRDMFLRNMYVSCEFHVLPVCFHCSEFSFFRNFVSYFKIYIIINEFIYCIMYVKCVCYFSYNSSMVIFFFTVITGYAFQ